MRYRSELLQLFLGIPESCVSAMHVIRYDSLFGIEERDKGAEWDERRFGIVESFC